MQPTAPPRFHPQPASILRSAIAEAGGIEVFAIGNADPSGRVTDLEIHARGNQHAVTALFQRVRPGQVVIHNHPSGVLQASEADLSLASHYGEQGVGLVIVDNQVERELWVVEPLKREIQPVDIAELERFFQHGLPLAVTDPEQRPGQLDMARDVAARLDQGGILAAEAGTGTGKSLAYLVPAVLWATANEERVVISTYTKALQDQLAGSDIPLAQAAGLQFEWALVKGRSNYLCRRKLQDSVHEEAPAGDTTITPGEEAALLRGVAAWAEVSPTGERSDLGYPVTGEQWERLASDRNQCLAARCPHFERCFYFEARRRAAGAHVVVVNHSLLLADLAIKRDAGGRGVLPAYSRVVMDEAHHAEQAATSAGTTRVTALAIRRAVAPLLSSRRRRRGALARLAERWGGMANPDLGQRDAIAGGCAVVERLASDLAREAPAWLEDLAFATGLDGQPISLERAAEPPPPEEHAWEEPPESPAPVELPGPWKEPLGLLVERSAETARAIGALEKHFLDIELEPGEQQPLLDLRQARLRLASQAASARAALEHSPEFCRWVEPEGRTGRAAICRAPIDVGPFLASALYASTRTLVLTSATLAVRNSFGFTLSRLGLEPPGPETPPVEQRRWTSPFDFAGQVLLGLPRDLPIPGHPDHDQAAAAFIVQALEHAGGGAFVLCTSFQQIHSLAGRVEAAMGQRLAILRQGDAGRFQLLERFREDPDSVLFGTDSFWEGVSVKGRALRLVIIPRLPFGVPTEPITIARHERLRSGGMDPFRSDTLPRAVLRLRQGFGRLVRSHSDRGVVLILDRRLHDRWYGRQFLAALPPATRAVGPARAVLERVRLFYQPPPA
jgi:ATP-dependent DNA helicase DinG